MADAGLRGIQLFSMALDVEAGVETFTDFPTIVGSTADHGLTASTVRMVAGEPSRFTLMKLPAPGLFAGGSLRTSLSAAVVGDAGEDRTRFVFDAINDGAIAATDTAILVEFPPSIVESVSCMVDGAACEPFVTARSLGVRRSIGVGQRVRISGKLRSVTGADYRPRLEASAFAPFGFVEMDMKDNVRVIALDASLFTDGFD